MDPYPPGIIEALTVAALLSASVQHAAHRRLDLAPLTLSLGLAAAMGGAASSLPHTAMLLSAVAVLSAVGSVRAARRGVGRPDLSGLVLAVAAVTWGSIGWGPAFVALPAGSAALAAPVLTVFTGSVTVFLARERRGLAGQRVFHDRTVPIRSRADGEEPS